MDTLLTIITNSNLQKIAIMNLPKGGRGKKANYETRVMRIPAPVASEVETLVHAFHSGEAVTDDELPTLPDAIATAQAILKSKKSARLSMQRLLTAIYGAEVNL